VFTRVLARGRGGVKRRRPWLAPALAAMAALLLAGGGYWTWQAAQPRELRVAVEPILPQGGDAVAAALVDGLARRISVGLTDQGTAVVPAEAAASPARGGARLVVGGSARRTGDTLGVDIQIEDRRNGLIAWSMHFERPVAEAGALGEQVTAKIADVVGTALEVLRVENIKPSSEALGGLMKQADMRRHGVLGGDQKLDIDRQFLRLAPRVGNAHGELAVDLAVLRFGRPAAVARAMEAEAREEAVLGLKLDPRSVVSYLALYYLLPDRDYASRYAVLAKAIAIGPQKAGANNTLGDFLREVGRNREAEPLYRRGLALDPLAPGKSATSIFALAGTGRTQESWALAQRALAQFPGGITLRRAYVYTAALYQPPDVALQAIDRIDQMGGVLDNGGARAWRDYVNGARRGHVDAAAIRRFREAGLKGLVDPSNAAPALALAGDVDGAFATFNRALDEGTSVYPSELFETAAAPMRRDPRFESLVGRLGILAFWKSTRIPPDFCGEPDPPPICASLPPKRS
jgi:TolB-like protein/tetratricopeptide (TPR) repeat protein